jgi:hypothetical protein
MTSDIANDPKLYKRLSIKSLFLPTQKMLLDLRQITAPSS